MNPKVGIIISVIVILIPLLFISAVKDAKISSNAVKVNDIDVAIKYARSATYKNPFIAQYKLDFANLLVKVENKSSVTVDRLVKSAESLSRNNVEILEKIGDFYLSTEDLSQGNMLKALDDYARATTLRPLRREEWQIRASGYSHVVNRYLQKSDTTNAVRYIDEALDLINQAKKVNLKNMDPFLFNTMTDESLERLAYTKENIKNKNVDPSQVVFYNMPSMDIDTNSIPDQWIPENGSGVQIRFENGTMNAIPTLKDKIGFIGTRNITILPGTKYRIEMVLSNAAGIKNIPFYISGVEVKNNGLTPVGNVFSCEIITPAEFKPSNNEFKVAVPVKYEIESVKINTY